MEPKVTSVRLYITELLQQSEYLLAILKEAKAEAARPHNEKWRAGAEHWANQSLENITRYVVKLKTATLEKNPKALSHVAESFASLGRYVGDYNYSWFTKSKELDEALKETCRSGNIIFQLIDVFDDSNMAEIKNSI